MSLNSQAFPAPGDHPGKIKHLYLRSRSSLASQEYAPCFYVEARIDFSDIRSGYHATRGINSILDLLPIEGDVIWTRDMVRPVDPAALLTSKPEEAKLRRLPAFVTEDLVSRIETQFLSYLLRNTEATVFRNFALNIYSFPGETRDDFLTRCLDLFKESFRGDMEALREVVNRRLERVEQKYLGQDRVGEFESERRMTQARSRLHAVSERIAEFFLQTELKLVESVLVSQYPSQTIPDMELRLEALEMDVRQEVRRLLDSYQEKVQNIDEYIIHPNLRDLHLVRTCILWMPVEAQP